MKHQASYDLFGSKVRARRERGGWGVAFWCTCAVALHATGYVLWWTHLCWRHRFRENGL